LTSQTSSTVQTWSNLVKLTWLTTRSSLTSSSSHSATKVQQEVVKRRARSALMQQTQTTQGQQ
jgi:hypothetical protein